jgi:uncharacterized protein with PIN domain
MIFVDMSAIVAVLAREADGAAFIDRLRQAEEKITDVRRA